MMPGVASGVLAGVADAALRAIVFAGVMGLALTVCRVRRAAARLWAWTIVLVVALTMPILDRAVPGLRWTIPAVAPIERFVALATPAAPAAIHDGGRAKLAPASVGLEQDRGAGAPRSNSLADTFRVSWPVLLLAVYLAGVFLLLLRAAMSWLAAQDLARDARAVPDSGAIDRLRRHASAVGLARVPVLAEASALSVPVTMSVTRPTIVLPRAWRAWSVATLDAVLAHEVAHIARRDTLTQRLSLCYRAVAWFSPLSWWLHHRLADLAEQASDDAALAAGADRTEYAETLVAFFAELKRAPRRAEWHVAMARGRVASAERRVDRILMWKGDRTMKLTRRFLVGVLVAAAPVAVVTAAVHVAFAPPGPPVLATRITVPPAPTPAPAVTSTPTARPLAPVAPSSDAAESQRQTQEPVYEPGKDGVTSPVPIRQPEPKYTSAALREKIQGEVEMKAVVLPNGTVADVHVTRSLDSKFGLDETAIKAAKQWLFKPATKDGKPVAVEVTLVLTFRTHDSPRDQASVAPADPGPAELRNEVKATLATSQTPPDDFVTGAYPENTPDLVAPRPTHQPEPKYTSAAMRAKIQGTVVIEAVIGTDGTVVRARVAQSLDKDYGLDDEALKAAKQWVFEPATLKGQKVPVLVKLILVFRLH